MVTAGIWLIYAGVVLRILELYAGLPELGLVALLLALYGILLFVESFFRHRASSEQPGFSRALPGQRAQNQCWLAAVYLLLQASLVIGLFSIPPHVDFFAGLFVPLSLQAVLFFGRPLGFLCIAVFPLAMFGSLTVNDRNWPFALTMSVFSGGLCLLFGSYADQVRRAESARYHNRRMLGDLHAANRQLERYAVQVEDLAAEQERSRLARELHDSVTQTVFSMNLTVQSARLLLDRDPGRVAGQLDRLEELATSAMGEIHSLVVKLRPASITEQGLPGALQQLVAERLARDGLQVDLEFNGERDLPETSVIGLYRIAHEALTNVVKHSGTLEAAIRLSLGADPPWLEIEDRGRGFDPRFASGQGEHMGLAGMAEQAREIGWHLKIDSRHGLGTCIRAEESLSEKQW